MKLHAHLSHSEKIVINKSEIKLKGSGLFKYVENSDSGERYYFHKDGPIKGDLMTNDGNGEITLHVYTINLPKLIFGTEFSDWHTWAVKFIFSERIHEEFEIQSLEEYDSSQLQEYLKEIGKLPPILVSNSASNFYMEIMPMTGPCICPKMPSLQNLVKIENSNLKLLEGTYFKNTYNLDSREPDVELWAYPILGYVDNNRGNCPQQEGELIDFILLLNESEKNELKGFERNYPGKDPRNFSVKIAYMPRYSPELHCFYYNKSDIAWDTKN